ncbi:MAG: class I SAM-dependent methyltransferase [Chlamydiae bacterium]|nr:class I SAM-dependent methyltransferase [Chlamydiota bacterium]
MQEIDEKKTWDETKDLLGNHSVSFGRHWSFNFRNDPKRLGFVLSRYKFSSKMILQAKSVLELGCSEGIGASLLAKNAGSYTGIDLDEPAIISANKNFDSDKYTFIHDDFMDKKYGEFDAVISLDVIEHIHKEYEDLYFKTLIQNCSENGIVVVGTPNITSDQYASPASKLGHVNLYSQQRLADEMKKYFHQVFSFGMNDEIAHTGFAGMCHYLFCVGCHRR